MSAQYEHTNPINAMHDSLRALNTVLVNTTDLEQSAKDEALLVKQKLDSGRLSFSELVDYLHQAAIDVHSHHLFKCAQMIQERGR